LACDFSGLRAAIKEERYWHLQNLCGLLKSARTYSIRPLFVFLNLLKCERERVAQFCLRHAEHHLQLLNVPNARRGCCRRILARFDDHQRASCAEMYKLNTMMAEQYFCSVAVSNHDELPCREERIEMIQRGLWLFLHPA
jgi:hypothetical protein